MTYLLYLNYLLATTVQHVSNQICWIYIIHNSFTNYKHSLFVCPYSKENNLKQHIVGSVICSDTSKNFYWKFNPFVFKVINKEGILFAFCQFIWSFFFFFCFFLPAFLCVFFFFSFVVMFFDSFLLSLYIYFSFSSELQDLY